MDARTEQLVLEGARRLIEQALAVANTHDAGKLGLPGDSCRIEALRKMAETLALVLPPKKD